MSHYSSVSEMIWKSSTQILSHSIIQDKAFTNNASGKKKKKKGELTKYLNKFSGESGRRKISSGKLSPLLSFDKCQLSKVTYQLNFKHKFSFKTSGTRKQNTLSSLICKRRGKSGENSEFQTYRCCGKIWTPCNCKAQFKIKPLQKILKIQDEGSLSCISLLQRSMLWLCSPHGCRHEM